MNYQSAHLRNQLPLAGRAAQFLKRAAAVPSPAPDASSFFPDPGEPVVTGSLAALATLLPSHLYQISPHWRPGPVAGQQPGRLPISPLNYGGPQISVNQDLPALLQRMGLSKDIVHLGHDPSYVAFMSEFPEHLAPAFGYPVGRSPPFVVNIPSAFGGSHVSGATGAHELGHVRVQDWLKRRGGPALERMSRNLAAVGPQIGLGAASVAALLPDKYALPLTIASTLAMAPTMISELAASHYGGKGLSQLHGGGIFRRLRNYLAPYRGVPTYAAAAALPALTYGLRPLYRHWFGQPTAANNPFAAWQTPATHDNQSSGPTS
jgi:hypothetical protein